MSGVTKFVKKSFKRKLNSFKKTWKWVALAVAVYFTAGLALSAMPATAGFAASMPGITAASAATGIGSAGAFSTAAVSTGAVGTVGTVGATGAAGAAAAGTIPEVVVSATAAGGGAGALGAGAVAAGAGAAAASGGGASAAAPAAAPPAAPAAAPPAPAVAPAAKGGMSLSEKLLVASTITSTVSGLAQPSAKDIAEQQKRWSGAFYGVDRDGSGSANNVGPLIPTSQPKFGPQQRPAAGPAPGITMPKRTVPTKTQQQRDALVRSPMVQQQEPYQYGRDTLIPTSDQPFESLGEEG